MARVKIYINTRIYDELIKCQVVRCSKTRSLGVSTKVNAMATVRCRMQTTIEDLGARRKIA